MRIHIGNISPKLAEDPKNLETRLSKYGPLQLPLQLKCKPLADHYYAFVDVDVDSTQWGQMKKAFNGVVFMGMKLLMQPAKPAFVENRRSGGWGEQEAKHNAIRQEIINTRRSERIQEATTAYLFKQPLVGVAPVNSAYGYHMSPHTFQNISGNTKYSAPQTTLLGKKSYGAWTTSNAVNGQEYSTTSGNGQVVQGRIRKTPRKRGTMRDQTLRILVNGELKTFKSYKTKLWGFQTRPATALTSSYVDGEWRLGDGHVIERVQKVSGIQVGDEEAQSVEVDDSEAVKSKQVLALFLGGYDFDKPMEIDEDNGIDAEDITYDSKGRRKVAHFDYEMQGGDVEEGISGDASQGMAIIEATKQQEAVGEVYFSEEDDDIDFASLQPEVAMEEDVDEQLITGAPTEEVEDEMVNYPTEDAPVETEVETSTNNTESLRTLLNSGPSQGFSLALAEDDDDVDQLIQPVNPIVIEQIKEKQDQIIKQATKKYGLFWSHLDSAFLASQSQFNQIGTVGTNQPLPDDDYEAWFYKLRSEVTSECKRNRRDVQRAFKKKKVVMK